MVCIGALNWFSAMFYPFLPYLSILYLASVAHAQQYQQQAANVVYQPNYASGAGSQEFELPTPPTYATTDKGEEEDREAVAGSFGQPTAQPKGRKLFAAAATVCRSPEFQLTLENWRISRSSDFLQQWSEQLLGNPDYARRGIIGSLAYAFLGRNEFHCTLGTSHSCLVTCPEVIGLVNDPQEARAVYFILTAARHYLEIMEVADRGLLAAQVNVGQWTDSMANRFYWTQETMHDRVFRTTVQLMQSFMSFVMFTFVPMIPFNAMESAIAKKITEIKEMPGLEGEDVDRAALELMEKGGEARGEMKVLGTLGKYGGMAWDAGTTGIPILGVAAPDLFAWEGYERATAMNVAELGLAVSHLVSQIREKNAKGVGEAFSGRVIDKNGMLPQNMSRKETVDLTLHTTGISILSTILEPGGFLAVSTTMMNQWTGPTVEKRLTDALKYRIFSEALKSQNVFIHCTSSMNAFTCENDSTGPQNLKACIDNRVCYMNKWSGRGYYWRHHVEEPFGVDQMGDWPLLLVPEDIIIGSYKTYQLTSSERAKQKVISQEELVSPTNFMDATTPGAFYLPVCVNDRFHQNTPLDDHSLIDDFNPNSEKKTLPCSCGTFWGDETESVWHGTGLNLAPHADKYRTSFCPRQLDTKMSDNKLERFVADCRLDIAKTGWFGGYREGKHPFCEVVIDLVTKHGKGPEEMDPYLKLALECKIGLLRTSVTGKIKKECEIYAKAGFEELLSKVNPKARDWGFV